MANNGCGREGGSAFWIPPEKGKGGGGQLFISLASTATSETEA